MNIRTLKRAIMKAQMKAKGYNKINKNFKKHWHKDQTTN